jgi:hypothetical protein
VLHDELNAEQIVDSEAALEFMKEATKLAAVAELEDIGRRLEAKSAIFRDLLSEDRIGDLDEEGLRSLTKLIFSLRRKATRLIRKDGIEAVRAGLVQLLYGKESLPLRFDRLLQSLHGVERIRVATLASEALHFTQPERYSLWTPWIWDPERGVGALRLVVQDDWNLDAETPGAVYELVGQATAVVHSHGRVAGYSRTAGSVFATDIFLACVYAVYMYTVFRVKLSQEFNRILPELPELVRRVLGVHRMEEIHVGAI